ncbi:MAG: hypothetical protein HWQ41_30710 [Nostoc sp. NOS(2021)]|nr:hypothetical protein [Nostoc sp. NOS(2021)]
MNSCSFRFNTEIARTIFLISHPVKSHTISRNSYRYVGKGVQMYALQPIHQLQRFLSAIALPSKILTR